MQISDVGGGSFVEIPQTVLALRGSRGVGIEGAMDPLWIRARTPPLIFAAICCTW